MLTDTILCCYGILTKKRLAGQAKRFLSHIYFTKISAYYRTVSTLIIFVVPDIPTGTPEVITAVSPLLITPCTFATSIAWSNNSKTSFFSSTGNGDTPQDIFSCRHTFSEVLPAMISQAGRYREIIRAERPDFVTVTIALAFRSYAVVHVA